MENSDTSHNPPPPPPKPIVLRSLVDVLFAEFSTCVESLFHPCKKYALFLLTLDRYKFIVHGKFGHKP